MTSEQIERLVKAYYECELSRSEEAELRRVLATTPISSKDIDSCRLEMGIEASMRQPRREKRAMPFKHWVSIAAAVALIAGLYVTFAHRADIQSSQETTIVYIAGKKVEDYAYAKKLVEQSQAESMAEMHRLLNETKAEKQNYDLIMNEMSNNR